MYSNYLLSVNTCIRRTKGMCCVEYQVCAADTQGIALTDTTGVGAAENIGVEGIFNEGWSIDIDTNPFVEDAVTVNMGMFDSLCSGDYVEIPCKNRSNRYFDMYRIVLKSRMKMDNHLYNHL